MKRDEPCYMCPARTPSCHCTCDKYRETMLKYIERREHRRAEANMISAMRDMAFTNKHRNEVIA